MKKNVIINFILVALALSSSSCENISKNPFRIIAEGTLSKKLTREDAFAYSNPDGAGMNIRMYKMAILNHDTIGYDKEYPVQTTLLNRNQLIDTAKTGLS